MLATQRSRWASFRTRQVPILEDPRHRAECGSERKDVEHQRFSGITTLPVSRKSRMNMMPAISPSTSGKRDAMAHRTVSIDLRGAGEIDTSCRPVGTACRRSRLSFGAVGEQRSCAVDGEERAALSLARRC